MITLLLRLYCYYYFYSYYLISLTCISVVEVVTEERVARWVATRFCRRWQEARRVEVSLWCCLTLAASCPHARSSWLSRSTRAAATSSSSYEIIKSYSLSFLLRINVRARLENTLTERI